MLSPPGAPSEVEDAEAEHGDDGTEEIVDAADLEVIFEPVARHQGHGDGRCGDGGGDGEVRADPQGKVDHLSPDASVGLHGDAVHDGGEGCDNAAEVLLAHDVGIGLDLLGPFHVEGAVDAYRSGHVMGGLSQASGDVDSVDA